MLQEDWFYCTGITFNVAFRFMKALTFLRETQSKLVFVLQLFNSRFYSI